jgi:hypothetical protein
MFLSVEIGEEMREYPEYDDHNSTLATKWPKNAIPTIKSQQIQAIKPAATTNIPKESSQKNISIGRDCQRHGQIPWEPWS